MWLIHAPLIPTPLGTLCAVSPFQVIWFREFFQVHPFASPSDFKEQLVCMDEIQGPSEMVGIWKANDKIWQCHQPVGWISLLQKRVFWSWYSEESNIEEVCCWIHIRLGFLSCGTVSVSILQPASLLRWSNSCHLAGNLLSWSVASIKMLLLSRGSGKETNSLGSNSPFKTIALFRKVIEPQAAPSFCTWYIIDKQQHSSIHSNHTPCRPGLGLVLWHIVVFCKPGQRQMSERSLHRNLSSIHLSETLLWYASHILFSPCFHWHASKWYWSSLDSHQQNHWTPQDPMASVWENVSVWLMHLKQFKTSEFPALFFTIYCSNVLLHDKYDWKHNILL